MPVSAQPLPKAPIRFGAGQEPTHLYAVVLDSPVLADQVYGHLLDRYGSEDVYRGMNDTFLLVSSVQGGAAQQIAEQARLGNECRGVVFPLGVGYSGVATKDLWLWLDEKM